MSEILDLTDKLASGWVYLLPRETQKVIVKYSPKWLVSCVLPACEKELTFKRKNFDTDEWSDGKEIKLQIPDIILSHSFRKPWLDPSLVDLTEEYFLIHAADLSDENVIKTAIYRLANVYTNGKVCFGEIEQEGSVRNLRQANTLFWGTPFNDDAHPFYDIHANKCKERDHEYYSHASEDGLHSCSNELLHECETCDPGSSSEDHMAACACSQETCACPCQCSCCLDNCDCHCDCECCMNVCGCPCGCNLTEQFFQFLPTYNDVIKNEYIVKTKFFCGDRYFACPKPTAALFITNSAELLNNVPEKYWKQDGQKTKVLIGTIEQEPAVKDAQTWLVDLGGLHLRLANFQISII